MWVCGCVSLCVGGWLCEKFCVCFVCLGFCLLVFVFV